MTSASSRVAHLAICQTKLHQWTVLRSPFFSSFLLPGLFLGTFFLGTFSAPVSAAQIVALDLKAAGGASKQLAAALNPLLVAELSKREGMSIVSQSDVRALLEHEADRAAMGCDETSCMTDIAGSLGAELLASSTVSKIGRDIVVTITLLQVDGAKVVRRASGRARGVDGAADAVAKAVHGLFKTGLPSELAGPASLSRRGFAAALSGMKKSLVENAWPQKKWLAAVQASRQRVVLDIVNTELDYDAAPKFTMLQQALQESSNAVKRQRMGSQAKKEAEQAQRADEMVDAIWDDFNRVKEIRERARAQGLVPSARPLRFQQPEPPSNVPDPVAWARYRRETEAARKVAIQFLRAYRLQEDKKLVALLTPNHDLTRVQRDLKNKRAHEKKNDFTYQILPHHAHTYRMMTRCIDSLEKKDRVIFALRLKKNQAWTEKRLTLVKEKGQWRVKNW